MAAVVIAGGCYLMSDLLLWRAQAAYEAVPSVSPQITEHQRVATAYGAILQQIEAEKGPLQLQELLLDEKGLVIYASAPDWAEAAAFSERLKNVVGRGSMSIVRSEKLLRLENNTPISYVALTIRLEWEGGYTDEG